MKKNLRERGIYQLPDKREFVVGMTDRSGFALFELFAWKYRGSAEYLVRADGKILSRGVPTRWSVQDLTDTGRTAEPR